MAKKTFKTNVDLNQNELQSASLQKTSGSPTASPTQSQIYFDTDDNKMKYYSGVTWRVPAVVFNDLEDVDFSNGLTNSFVLEFNNGTWSATGTVSNSSNAENLNGFSGSYYLDLGNSTGTLPPGAFSIASNSQNYLSYATATGELSISSLAITDVTTDNSATSSSDYFSTNYTGSEFQEGDTVILTAISSGTEIFMHNGGTAGTPADFTSVETPHLDDDYIRSLFTATTPLNYNNTTGDFTITQSGTTTGGYLSSVDWNTFNTKVDTVNGLTGTTITLDTDDISEGTTNLYFTASRARESLSAGFGVTYSSITGTIGITAADYRDFSPTSSVGRVEGRVFYDDTSKSLSLYTDIDDVTHNLGQEFFVRVLNNTGATISNGKIVYIDGSDNNLPTVGLADANVTSKATVLGISTHDIGISQQGFITTGGVINDIDTSIYNFGDDLYLSETPGEFTPIAPRTEVLVAKVISATTSGSIILSRNKPQYIDVVYVRSLFDLPDPVGNNITLRDGFIYQFNGDINIGTYSIIMGSSSTLSGNSRYNDSLQYTGTGIGIIGHDVDFSVKELKLSAPNGQLFEIKDTAGNEATSSVDIVECLINDTNDVGTVENLNIMTINNNLMDNYTNGFVFGGTQNGHLNVHDNLIETITNTFIDLNSSEWETVNIYRNQIHLTSGTAISGSTGSGNLVTDGYGNITSCNFIGNAGATVEGISKSDIYWNFQNNTAINDNVVNDSEIVGELYMNNNSTETIISTASTPTKILGTTTSDELERFENPTNNRLTYTGYPSIRLIVNANITFTSIGNNQIIGISIAKNGISLDKTISRSKVGTGTDTQFISCTGLINFSQGDYVEVFVTNYTSATNVTVSDLNLNVR